MANLKPGTIYYTGNEQSYGDVLCRHAHRSYGAALACLTAGLREVKKDSKKGSLWYRSDYLVQIDDPATLVKRKVVLG